jgi:hypothetical protein
MTEYVVLSTKRKKTLNFYNKNRNIDFEMVNEMVVDLFEKVLLNANGEMSMVLTKEISEMVSKLNDEMMEMKETINKSNKEIQNNILLKLYEQRGEYMNEMRLLIEKRENDNLLKIIDRMEKEQIKIINEIIPKTNTEYYNKYESLINKFKEEISGVDKIEILERKHNDMIKGIEMSIINYLSKSEDRMQTNMNEIKAINIINSEISKEISDSMKQQINRYNNSTLKGQIAENRMEELICSIFKSAEVSRTTKESKSGDIILRRVNERPILFEIKDYSRNVPIDEIDKFIRDINEMNMSGIMLSISSGISNKKNYQIEITKKNNICVYVHNMNYDIEKVRLAVDIIDNLSEKIIKNNNNINISMETLEQINSEYQTFILKRNMAINHIKETTKKTIQYIEEMELKNLNNYLASKFTFKNSSTLKCDKCNFVGTNSKSLAAHKRKCKGVPIIDSNKNDVNNDSNDSYDNIDDNIDDNIEELSSDTIKSIESILSSTEEEKKVKKKKLKIKKKKPVITIEE